ncbi:hypothetical protein BDZ97DRAFT_1912076 [Flammula alnicola]|nr:hypothetical protein BDZ97DRAFT_1912076 [Flammula alnicola]
MSDLSTVRAEIKAWERSFKDTNGRAPTVNDIKANNAIADKYKLYKRFSKAAASSNTSQIVNSNPPPSTPPRTTRPREPSSILLSKSRAVEPTAPLATFNPFSPQKKGKGKEREQNPVNRIDESRSNPFGKSQSTSRTQRQKLSPDPFPPIQPTRASFSTSSSSFSLIVPPEPTSAVSRARKRLRGEPVSPSPNKDKRRRVTSQTTLPFPRLNLDAPSSDEDEAPPEADSSFVDNSPIKAPTTGKLFPKLFEENLVPMALFGVKGDLGLMNVDSQGFREASQKATDGVRRTRRAPTSKVATTVSEGVNTESSSQRSISKLPSQLNHRNGKGPNNQVSSNRSSAKRALSDEEVDKVNQPPPPRAKSPLIPPSPPPADSNPSYNRPGKNKAKGKGDPRSRKKVKVDGKTIDDDDSDEQQSQAKLRIVGRNALRSHAAAGLNEDDVTSDSDPILGYTRFAAPRAASPNDAQQEDGSVEIDLPDKLRSVLALQSAASKMQVSEEDRLVKGLLYGRRINHYDPNKGGEIWDVGEDDHIDPDEEPSKYTEGEDDWEGEPVPWEVGEL